jgi:hypothetical protein
MADRGPALSAAREASEAAWNTLPLHWVDDDTRPDLETIFEDFEIELADYLRKLHG